MPELPELGVGVLYLPGLEQLLQAGSDVFDVIEIEPQTLSSFDQGEYHLNRADVDRLRAMPVAKLVHGVGAPIGGTVTHEPLVKPLLDAVESLEPPWASEHLAFNRFTQRGTTLFTGFMLPPMQSAASVQLAVDNIRRVQDRIGVPFAFETPVNYMRSQEDEMTDGAFLAEIALQADCGILLDLHNVWCNERNGRQPIMSMLRELPLNRVWEMHLADGRQLDGYWVDAHSGLISDDLFELAESVVAQLPNLKAMMFEIMPDYMVAAGIDAEDVIRQAERMRGVWEQRGSATTNGKPPATRSSSTTDISPSRWEQTLGGLVTGHGRADTDLGRHLRQDPGTAVYRKMAESVRAGMIADVLTLTFRLLMLSTGEDGVRDCLAGYWADCPPNQAALEEARSFSEWLRGRGVGAPHAAEVAAFEVASLDVQKSGVQHVVAFSCEPMALLTALGEGRLPGEFTRGSYELVLEPDAA